MNFVTCNLIGPSTIGGVHYFGLANQMFQIAAALSYGKENNLNPIFPMLNNKNMETTQAIFLENYHWKNMNMKI